MGLLSLLPSLLLRGKQRLGGSHPLGAFLDDLFVSEMQGSKFGTFILSVFRNLVRENGWRRDNQCFFSAFKCSQQQLLCWSGEWSEHLSLCACVPGVGCGSVERWNLEWRDLLLFLPLFFIFCGLALSSGLESIVQWILSWKEVFGASLSGFGKLRVDSWLCHSLCGITLLGLCEMGGWCWLTSFLSGDAQAE